MKRFFVLLLLVMLAMATQPIHAKMPVMMALKDLKPGAQAIGFSVFWGVEPQPFAVELGQVFSSGGQQYIAARISGRPPGLDTPLEQTSTIPGMSGSPVFLKRSCSTLHACIDHGILVGAVSLRLTVFPLGGMNTGITPAVFMFGAKTQGFGSAAGSMSGTANPSGELIPLAASPAEFVKILAVHELAISSGMPDTCAQTQSSKLQAGSMISVVMARGDFPIAGSGTVTWRDVDKIYAFGHPLFGNIMGAVRYPFVQVGVSQTLQSSYASTKIAGCIVGNEGVIVADGPTEISGEVGQAASFISLHAAMRIGKAIYTLREEVTANTPATDSILINIPQLWAGGAVGARKDVSFSYMVRVVPQGQSEILFKNTGFSELVNGLPINIPLSLVHILEQLRKSGFAHDLQSVHLETEIFPKDLERWEKEKIFLSKTEAAPGETILLSIVLRKFPGGTPLRWIEVPITVPADILMRKPQPRMPGMPPVPEFREGAAIDILVQSGIQFTDKRLSDGTPRTLEKFIAKFNQDNAAQANVIYVQQIFPPKVLTSAQTAFPENKIPEPAPKLAAPDAVMRWKDIADPLLIPANTTADEKPEIVLQALPALEGIITLSEMLKITVKAPTPPETKTNFLPQHEELWLF